jgi:hypothetical protein
MGVSATNVRDLVLPNLSNFHDVVKSGAPLGFMKMDG